MAGIFGVAYSAALHHRRVLRSSPAATEVPRTPHEPLALDARTGRAAGAGLPGGGRVPGAIGRHVPRHGRRTSGRQRPSGVLAGRVARLESAVRDEPRRARRGRAAVSADPLEASLGHHYRAAVDASARRPLDVRGRAGQSEPGRPNTVSAHRHGTAAVSAFPDRCRFSGCHSGSSAGRAVVGRSAASRCVARVRAVVGGGNRLRARRGVAGQVPSTGVVDHCWVAPV